VLLHDLYRAMDVFISHLFLLKFQHIIQLASKSSLLDIIIALNNKIP